VRRGGGTTHALGGRSTLPLDAAVSDETKALIDTQYDALRQEITTQLTQIHGLELAALGAVGGIWTWLFANAEVNRLAWFVPVVLVVLGAAKVSALFLSVRIVGRYIAAREASLFTQAGRWETYRQRKSARLVVFGVIFWALLFVATLTVALWQNIIASDIEPSASALTLKCVPNTTVAGNGITLSCSPIDTGAAYDAGMP